MEDYFENYEAEHGTYTCVGCGRKLKKDDIRIEHIMPQGQESGHKPEYLCEECGTGKHTDVRTAGEDHLHNVHRVPMGHEADETINRDVNDSQRTKMRILKK